jgi:hypothetical protein
MKLTELIKEAQEALQEFGDIDVCVFELELEKTFRAFHPAGIMLAKEKEDDKDFVFCIADEELLGSVDDASEE